MRIVKQFLADPTEKFAVFLSEEEMEAVRVSVIRNISDYPNDPAEELTLHRMRNTIITELDK